MCDAYNVGYQEGAELAGRRLVFGGIARSSSEANQSFVSLFA